MYLGRVVEQTDTPSIFAGPQHPYTRALMRSIPGLGGQRKTKLQVISGSVPDPFQRIAGCPFHPRCPEAQAGLCDRGDAPPLREVRPGHRTSCLLRHKEAGLG
jgi:peptide/nickel transport system ATP-binding protein